MASPCKAIKIMGSPVYTSFRGKRKRKSVLSWLVGDNFRPELVHDRASDSKQIVNQNVEVSKVSNK